MAGSVNKVILVGHVGADPEIRSTQGGSQIANLRLATSESWKDKRSGERKEKTEWHTVVIFNEHLVEVVDKYVKKGSKLYIEGQLQTRKWEDRDGNDRYSTEVVVAAFKGEIQMLSSTRDGNEDGDEDRGSSRRGGSSRSSRSDDNDRGSSRRGGGSDRSDRSDRGGSRSGGGSSNSSSDDFDDEIPF